MGIRLDCVDVDSKLVSLQHCLFPMLCLVWFPLTSPRVYVAFLFAQALQHIMDLGFIPLVSTNVDRLIQNASHLHPAVAERLADVIEAAADALAAQQQGASRGNRFVLKQQLEALLSFANGVSLRVGKSLFQKLAATAANFS